MLLCPNTASSQTVFEDWVQTRGTQSYFLKSIVKTDSYRNVYQAGATLSDNGDYDVIITKFNSRGQELWTKTYDVAGYDDAAIDIYIDENQDVYLAGTTFNAENSGYQVLILKYKSNGDLLWSDVYSHPNSLYNVATSITGFDNQIYVGGATYSLEKQSDFLAISYSGSGNLEWIYTWDNVALNDVVTKIDYHNGYISLAGGAQIDPNRWRYAIVNLNSADGGFIEQKITGGSGVGIDRITDLTRDNAGNIYVTGGVVNSATGYDFKTLKLDSDLNVAWEASYNSSGHNNDIANALAVDPFGNVYVTGYSETDDGPTNYTTLKYNADGVQQWVASYNGKGNRADTAKAIVLDANHQPVITGVSENTGNEDFHTLKYTTNGEELWHITYNGVLNGNDNPFDIAIDNAGDIIVAGQTEVDGKLRYVSVKYIERDILNPPDTEIIPSSGYFTKNAGQLIKTNGQLAKEVKFIAGADYPKVYIQNDKLSYVFHKTDSLADDTIHRIDMVFNKRTKNPRMRALDKMDFYQNFYLPTVADGKRERVESFKKLVSVDVWNNIDLMLSHNNMGLKYYLICKPGFNPADLGWGYEGATSVSVNGLGELVLTSSIGEVIMPKGEAYEVTSSGVRIDKSWQPVFNAIGSEVSLSIGAFNSNNTLVIEIDKGVIQGTAGNGDDNGNMLWNSHYGSGSESHFNDVVTDNVGDIYIVGETKNGDFPTLLGQTIIHNYSGGTDVLLLKLSVDVVPKWLTYFGGSVNANGYAGNDIAKAITLRKYVQDAVLNDIYICGYTNSVDMTIENDNGSFPVDSDNNCSSGICLDGFVAQFDLNGILHWSTYYGKDGDETLRDIKVDKLGNIYAVGSRNSNTTPVQKSGASNYTSGSGLLIQYDVNRNLVWPNPWDGEIVMSLDIDGDNNVYTTGGTKSENMPVLNTDPGLPTTASLYSTGKLDAFVNKFNVDGQLEFSSYFGGHCPEAGNSIVVDKFKNVYFAGNTKAEIPDYNCVDNMPLVNALPTITSNFSDFLVKVNLSNTTANISYSSYIGGSYIDGWFYPGLQEAYEKMRIKLAISNSGILYLATYSRSSYNGSQIGMPLPSAQPSGFYVKDNLTIATNDPISNAPGDNYIAAFNQNMDLIWATYHGSNKYDYCGGIAISDNKRLVMVGTGNQGIPAMDISSFDPVDYDDSSDLDYYQAGPAINPSSTTCGQGVIFDVSQINNPVSIRKSGDASYIDIWPNPTNSSITINSNSQINDISLYDISGRIIQKYNGIGQQAEIDISIYPSGVYIIKVENSLGVFSRKFVRL